MVEFLVLSDGRIFSPLSQGEGRDHKRNFEWRGPPPTPSNVKAHSFHFSISKVCESCSRDHAKRCTVCSRKCMVW